MNNLDELFSVEEYYKRVVMPLSKKYRISKGKMVCPLHDDHDPSLGVIPSRNGNLIHCFGCNFWGNIVDFHKKLMRTHYKKYLSDDEALSDLCRIFGVEEKPDISSTTNDSSLKRELELSKAIEKFDIGDYRTMVLDGKREGRGIAYFNTITMMMISEVKGEQKDGNL